MCNHNKTDVLIAEVLRINSPFKNFDSLIPKIVYHTDSDDDVSGIFFDTDREQLVHADIENGEILEQYDVVPTHIEHPNTTGQYAYSEDKLLELHDCDFCGEADDLSCYVYFDAIDEVV